MKVFQRARNLAHARLKDCLSRKVPHAPEKTLVIIDMQNYFMCEEEREIVPAICSLILHAKQNEWAIIVVEFRDYGETVETIQGCLSGYPHWTTVYKTDCDGGNQVIKCIQDHPTWSMDLLVCGIYGPGCVAATVYGLFDSSNLVEVSVVLDAIAPDYHSCSGEQEIETHTEDIFGSRQEDCNSPVPS